MSFLLHTHTSTWNVSRSREKMYRICTKYSGLSLIPSPPLLSSLTVLQVIIAVVDWEWGYPGLAFKLQTSQEASQLPPTFSVWIVVSAALVWSWGVCWGHHTWHGWATWPGGPGVSAGGWQWQDAGLSLPLSANMGVICKKNVKISKNFVSKQQDIDLQNTW